MKTKYIDNRSPQRKLKEQSKYRKIINRLFFEIKKNSNYIFEKDNVFLTILTQNGQKNIFQENCCT